MSVFSIGKNEIDLLLKKELQLKSKLTEDFKNVSSFQTIVLKKELDKIHTKLKVLGYKRGNSDNIA